MAMLGPLPARTRKGGMERNSLTTQKKKKAVDDMVIFVEEEIGEDIHNTFPLQSLTVML